MANRSWWQKGTIGLGVAAALLITGCSASAPDAPAGTSDQGQPAAAPGQEMPQRGGTFNFGVTTFRSWDVHQETYGQVTSTAGPAYDTILQYDPFDGRNTKIIPALAERWEQTNDTTYLFHFRKGVKWHDGVDFTAEDAKYTVDRIRQPPPGVISHRKDWFKEVAEVEVVDPLTLKIVLKRPQGSFLSFIAAGYNILVPKHVLEKNQEALKDTMIGTGPFKAQQLDRNVGGTLVRNPDYWDIGVDGKPKPYLDSVKFTVLTAETSFAAFRSGRIDMHSATPDQLEVVKKELPQVQYEVMPSLGMTHFRLNHRQPPFNDVRVRQAFSLAIDRDAIINTVVFGVADLASTMPATGSWNIPEEELRKLPGYRKDKAADIAKAKELLAQAGYSNGMTVKLMLGQSNVVDNVGLIVKEQLKPLGIELVPDKQEFVTYLNRTDKGDFEFTPYSMASSVDDPDDFLAIQYRTGGGRNYGGFSDPDVDRLIDQQSATLDPAKRKQIVRELTLKLAERVGQIELYWGKRISAWHPWLKNWVTHIDGTYNYNRNSELWIDSKAKR